MTPRRWQRVPFLVLMIGLSLTAAASALAWSWDQQRSIAQDARRLETVGGRIELRLRELIAVLKAVSAASSTVDASLVQSAFPALSDQVFRMIAAVDAVVLLETRLVTDELGPAFPTGTNLSAVRGADVAVDILELIRTARASGVIMDVLAQDRARAAPLDGPADRSGSIVFAVAGRVSGRVMLAHVDGSRLVQDLLEADTDQRSFLLVDTSEGSPRPRLLFAEGDASVDTSRLGPNRLERTIVVDGVAWTALLERPSRYVPIGTVFLLVLGTGLMATVLAVVRATALVRDVADRLERVDELELQLTERGLAEAAYADANRSLADAVAEREVQLSRKDLLLREMNHRIKNNLQLMNALIQLHRHRVSQPELQRAFDDIMARLAAVSQVHDRIRQSSDRLTVSMDAYLQSLIDGLVRASTVDERVPVRVETDSLPMIAEQAIPVALIVNELVTNALKYGRPQGLVASAANRTMIDVSLRKVDDHMRLVIRDRGPGLPGGTKRRTGLGTILVESLTQQLDGTVSYENAQPGLRVTVEFPAPKS